MRISFAPALGQATIVPVPEDASEVQLLFRAAFPSEEDLAHAKRDGVRVQVWSDIPVEERALGEWGAFTFEFEETISDDSSSLAEGTFSLLPRSAYPSKGAVHLKITARLPLGHARFSYTYRLVYPSGEVKWLGEYGCNGSLVVERRDPRFNLHGGWKKENKGLHLWQSDNETSADHVEVAELTKEFDWLCWLVGGEGRILPHILGSGLGSGPARSSTVFITPRPRPNSVVYPASFALCGSPRSSIVISPSGTITYCSPLSGALRMWTLAENCIEQVLSSHSGPVLRLAHRDPASGHAFLTSVEGAQPLLVSIIPFSPIPTKSEVVLPIRTLGNLLPERDRTQKSVCLFSHGSSVARWITSEELSEKARITFIVDNGKGGQFSVAPVNTLDDVQPERAWEIAVVTPYSMVHVPPEPIHRLPTPPPSPPIQRVAKASEPQTDPAHVRRVSFDEPISSVIQESEDSTDEERPVPLTVARVYRQTPTRSMLRHYFGFILRAGFWFVESILWITFGFMFPQPRSRTLEEANQAGPRQPQVTEEGPSSAEVSKPGETEEELNLSTATISPAESDATIFSPQPSSDRIITLVGKAADESASSRLSPIFTADVLGGETKFLVRPAQVGHFDQVHIELNGQLVQPTLDPVNTDDNLFLATINGGERGGRLIVSVALGH